MPEPTSAASPGSVGRGLRIGRVNLEARQSLPRWKHASFVLASILFGLGVSVLILVLSGVDISGIFEEFIVLTFFDELGLVSLFVEWAPLILVGLSAALAFRIRFWNIGIEGQFFFGAIGAALVTLYDLGPESSRLFLMLVLAGLGGLGWVLVPLILKLRLGVNEIITTLLFNYIAWYFVQNQLFGPWQDPTDFYHHTAPFDSFERLPLIGWGKVHVGLFIAVGLALITWWIMEKSRLGVFMRFIGTNPSMALVVGIPVGLATFATVLLSGALAGAGGYVMAAGQEYRLTLGLAAGYGFSGIVIAFLARNNPLLVLVVSFLMAGLYVGGQSVQVFYGLPRAMIGLIQAIIVMCAVGSDFFVRYRVHWVR